MFEPIDLGAKNDNPNDDDGLWELETLVPQGKKITISRVEPSWAKSMLESIEVGPDFGLQYLIEEWGGAVLRIKVRGERGKIAKQFDVPLRSYPVKVRGEEVTESELRKGTRDKKSPPPPPQIQNIVPAQVENNTENLANTVAQLINVFQQSRQTDLKTLGSLLPQTTIPTPNNSLEQFLGMARAFKEMQGIFGSPQQLAPVSPSGETDFLGSLAPVLKELIKVRNQAPEPQTRHRPIPKVMPVPMKRVQTAAPVNPANIAVPVSQEKNEVSEQNPSLKEILDGMSPKEIANTCKNVFEELNNEDRNIVMQEFLEDMEVDGREPEQVFDDDDYEDSNEDLNEDSYREEELE